MLKGCKDSILQNGEGCAEVGAVERGLRRLRLLPRRSGVSRPARMSAGVFAFLLLSGCYHYVPVETRAVTEGVSVRVHLTHVELVEALESIPMDQRRVITGVVLGPQDGVLSLRREVVFGGSGRRPTSVYQVISIPMSAVGYIERQEISRSRTGLVLLGGGALLATMIVHITRDAGVTRGPEPPDLPVDNWRFFTREFNRNLRGGEW